MRKREQVTTREDARDNSVETLKERVLEIIDERE